MSITNEKLQTIKDNVSKVYRSGQMDVIKNANSLKGYKSSKAILLEDVSPVEHEMEVKVRGKNLLNLSNREIVTNTWSPNTDMRNFNGNQLFVGISANNYFITPNIVSYSIGETIKVTAKQAAYGLGYDVAVEPNTSYVFSSITTNGEIRAGLYNKDGTFSRMIEAVSTFTTKSTEYWAVVVLKQLAGNESIEASFSNIQLELGTTATDYESYNSDIQNVYSKNLIPFPYRELKLGTSTYNGVDFTVYEDGSILINGTATSNTTRYLYRNETDLLGLKSGITISGNKNASDNTQHANVYFMCNYYDSAGTMQIGIQITTITSGKTTITDDWKGLGIYLHIPSGKTLNNLLIKPQLEIGSTATYYEKYHEPYPLVIKKLGKNLFNINAHTSNNCYKDGIFSGTNKSSSKEYIYMGITDIWKIAYNSKLPITLSFDMKTEIDGEILVYTLGEYRINFNSSGGNSKVATTTEWQHFDITSSKIYFTTGTTGDYCHLSFYGIYGSGVIPSVKNLQIYLGDTIISEYEDYIVPTEYTPTADGTVNGVTSLYPNTTLMTDTDGVVIDCEYYKDVDKAYNKLSAEIALSGGE